MIKSKVIACRILLKNSDLGNVSTYIHKLEINEKKWVGMGWNGLALDWRWIGLSAAGALGVDWVMVVARPHIQPLQTGLNPGSVSISRESGLGGQT